MAINVAEITSLLPEATFTVKIAERTSHLYPPTTNAAALFAASSFF